jgi:uncharacterized membrane protein
MAQLPRALLLQTLCKYCTQADVSHLLYIIRSTSFFEAKTLPPMRTPFQ